MSDRLKTGYKLSHPDNGDEILITGISGYFPECDSVAELQEKLFNKVNLVTPEKNRWKSVNTEIPNELGTIKLVNKFDASFFGFDFKLAHHLDPMCRLLLERTYEALIDAGINPEELRNTKTGVFVGCCFYDSETSLLYEKLNSNEHGLTGCSHSYMACHISQWLGVTGPAYAVDTACSSSLYAVEQAFTAIRLGVCDTAIVCGANISLHPAISLQFTRLGMLSPQGKCKSFDNSANGYARSEAVTVCVLQKAKNSRRAYSQIIYAKTNCDGFKDNGITYPSGNTQKILLKEFYEECDISTSTPEYIEAHATGTTVGDPEELNAIDDVMCKDRKDPLLIGTIKSNIGHTEGASGLCSIMKLCIAYHTGFIPPNIHYNQPRKGIPALTEGRLKVVTEKQPWNCGLAAMNGFGFGGANSHVLFKNFNKKKVSNGLPNDNLPRLVCISGRTQLAVEHILNSLEKKTVDAEEIRLWHAIHNNNIPGHKYRGFAILESTPGGTVTLARDVKSYNNTHRPTCIVYPSAASQLIDVKELMEIPEFARAIHKCDAVLKNTNINLMDIITGKSLSHSSNTLHLYITTVALQIALTDVMNTINVRPDSFLGYGIGKVGCAYAEGILTVEEAMEITYNQGLGAMETPEKSNKKNISLGNGHDKKIPNTKFNKITSTKDLSGSIDCSLTLEDIIPLIPPNAVIVQVTPDDSSDNTLKTNIKNATKINMVEKDAKNVKHLLIGLGRLYEAGLNMKIEELYPRVTLPVSQGTPMFSHLVKWDHRENWYTYSFADTLKKMPSIENVVQIATENPNFDYLHGHHVGGRLLYPGSLYLQFAWKTLAKMHGCDYKDFSVVFENLQFLRATTIPKKGDLFFHIIIHPVSGEFELSENNTAVITGTIYPKKDIGKSFGKETSPDNCITPEKIEMSQKDFYREMKLRGYNYSGVFVGVLNSSIDGSISDVTWTNNWITFIDYVFQIKGLSINTRNLYIPTSCAKLSIDVDLHSKAIKSAGPSKKIEVLFDKDTEVTRCGGMEIRGFNATMISKKTDMSVPLYEIYNFIPNFGTDVLKIEDIIRLYVDIIIENTLVFKFRAIEVIDEEYIVKNMEPILKYVVKCLEIIPSVWPELNCVINKSNNQTTNKFVENLDHIAVIPKLPGDKSSILLVGDNLSRKEKILKDSDLCLRDGGFIISLEEDVTSVMKLSDKFDIIAIKRLGNEVIVLLKKKAKEEEKIFLKVDTFDESFHYITKLQEAMEQRKKIVLYANDEFSGILGFVNCLRREPGGDMIRCLFVTDPNVPAFDPDLPFYKNQLDKDIAYNIYKNGQWGTYRHTIITNYNKIKPSPHAYLNFETVGDLSSLKWFEGGLKENAQGKEGDFSFVQVYCSALNFRDVVTATGRVSVDAVARGRIAQDCVQGLEFSGKLANGTRVAGMGEKSLSNLVLCHKNLMMPIPDEWTFEDAASVMVAYSTVYTALDVLGKMKPGESILIHAGSGAVGQAALNVALNRGCNVFTTVGTPEKIEFIKRLYPTLKDDHIGNSRDTSFEQMIMKQTNGEGVNLVLNSLAEDKLLASVRCLGRKGRFLEIGKYDIFKNTLIEMSCHKNEISFHGVMLDYIFENISEGKKIVNLVIKGIANGEVRPITHCTFEKYDFEAAYRYMAGGKHIGKVMIKLRKEEDEKFAKPKPMLIDAHRRYTCDKDYVYILVGGLGGFGLELADWLVIRGARKLMMISSRGVSTGYQAKRIRTWISYGADIRVLTDDVTTESGCKKILESANAWGHIEAIFNLAGILSDALLQNQSPETFTKSFRPKALSTLHLDKLSRKMCQGLRDFVAFSSLASGRGNTGQSNYGLANSVMERICEKRRKDGFPGLAIQWGAIDDVGMLETTTDEQGPKDVGGIAKQKINSCLQSLDTVLMQSHPVVSCYVLAQKKVIDNAKKSAVEVIAQIIGIKDLKAISYQVSLADLGMDSIMASEVKQTLERDFDVVLAAQDIRTLTFTKLISLTTKDQDTESDSLSVVEQIKPTVKDDWTFDLRYFLQNFGEEENAFKPFIYMRTKSFPDIENMDNTPTKTLFMIPGLEGCASSLEPLCHNLNTKVCVLQLSFDNTPTDIHDMSDKLYKIIKPLIKDTSSFNLLGYSYGSVPLLELASRLESEGHMGTVFCIDGSPKWIKSLLKNRFDIANDVQLNDDIIKYVITASLPDNSFIQDHIQKILDIPNQEDRIDYIKKNLSLDLKYSMKFINTICTECTNRVRMVKDYKIDVTKKLKSPIVLIRPEYGVIRNFSDNYELNELSESEVQVHLLKGNHVSILGDPNCASIIEKYLS